MVFFNYKFNSIFNINPISIRHPKTILLYFQYFYNLTGVQTMNRNLKKLGKNMIWSI